MQILDSAFVQSSPFIIHLCQICSPIPAVPKDDHLIDVEELIFKCLTVMVNTFMDPIGYS